MLPVVSPEKRNCESLSRRVITYCFGRLRFSIACLWQSTSPVCEKLARPHMNFMLCRRSDGFSRSHYTWGRSTAKANFLDTKKPRCSEEPSAALINPYVCCLALDAGRPPFSILPLQAPAVHQTTHKNMGFSLHSAKAHNRIRGPCQVTTTVLLLFISRSVTLSQGVSCPPCKRNAICDMCERIFMP